MALTVCFKTWPMPSHWFHRTLMFARYNVDRKMKALILIIIIFINNPGTFEIIQLIGKITFILQSYALMPVYWTYIETPGPFDMLACVEYSLMHQYLSVLHYNFISSTPDNNCKSCSSAFFTFILQNTFASSLLTVVDSIMIKINAFIFRSTLYLANINVRWNQCDGIYVARRTLGSCITQLIGGVVCVSQQWRTSVIFTSCVRWWYSSGCFNFRVRLMFLLLVRTPEWSGSVAEWDFLSERAEHVLLPREIILV